MSLLLTGAVAFAMVGCKSAEVVPIADQQSKTPPANTKAGEAVRKFRERRQGGAMGPDAGVKAVN